MATLLGELDLHLFAEGTATGMWRHLGAQMLAGGVHFAVWAPNASSVSVVGDFNGWDRAATPMFPTESGIWKAYTEAPRRGDNYAYAVVTRDGVVLEKADPYAFHYEVPPKNASVVWDLDYEWGDASWMAERGTRSDVRAPMSVYEVHLGSWRKRSPAESLSYRDLAAQLAEYASSMRYSHVELMPVMEHPYYPSWGYQVTGFFAPTARYGTPQDLMYMIDRLHQADVGVILDWVPSHFATDRHGLGRFDGTALYEHDDPRRGFHPDWGSYIFNYGRNEVRSFLLSSASLWLDAYHADGLRVDGVASMLYLDYSRAEGEWVPNIHGGNEDVDAVSLLQRLNTSVYAENPGITTIAEESTAWGGVSRPVDAGGLGFGYKWDMGWMHDTLDYFRLDPVHRSHHQDDLTFRMLYAYDENFVLALSHDEVVHGKGSLLAKMPGDEWQQFANLRALYAYQYGLPGKKCLFMGGEFGQRDEWSVDRQLDWSELEHDNHAGMQCWVEALNVVLRREPALHELDNAPAGFSWIDAGDAGASVFAFARYAEDGRPVVVVLNLTPVPRRGYRIGVPHGGSWEVILNSDDETFWGSGEGSRGRIEATDVAMHGRENSLELDLPPLGALFLAGTDEAKDESWDAPL